MNDDSHIFTPCHRRHTGYMEVGETAFLYVDKLNRVRVSEHRQMQFQLEYPDKSQYWIHCHNPLLFSLADAMWIQRVFKKFSNDIYQVYDAAHERDPDAKAIVDLEGSVKRMIEEKFAETGLHGYYPDDLPERILEAIAAVSFDEEDQAATA